MDIGTVGIWFFLDAMTAPESAQFADGREGGLQSPVDPGGGRSRAVCACGVSVGPHRAARHRHWDCEYLGAGCRDDGGSVEDGRRTLRRTFRAWDRCES